MKKYAHNHPAVRAWTPELQRRKEVAQRARKTARRQDIGQRVETLIGLSLILCSLPTIVALSESNAPAILILVAPFSMIGFGMAILMEKKEQ